MTVRAHAEARRHGQRRFWADARRLARHRGIPLTKAAKLVRTIDARVLLLDQGDLTLAELIREIRHDVARAVRT